MIDKRILEFILVDQKEDIENRAYEELCFREEVKLVDLSSPQAQVVIGVRRSGKSTLCYQSLTKTRAKFAYVDFDDERLIGIDSTQLNDILETLYKIYDSFDYLFLDEIQNVEGWHLFVNRMLRKKMHVIITGSNAKLLSGELATHLTGRSKEISLYPFSFKEYCSVKKVDPNLKTTMAEAFRRKAFDEYMKLGGFPELMFLNDCRGYVTNLVNNILRHDIEQRYSIHYKADFEKMAHHLLNIVPTITSIRTLAELFGFKSAHTIKNYIDYLKQSYLLVGLPKYSRKSKLRISGEKLYAVDVSLMNYRENAFAGENLGPRLETIVLIQLLRKCRIEGLDLYYLNERSGECDFLVCRGNTVIQAIQVSYDISVEKTRRREINGLLVAAKHTGCNNLLLLTDHESAVINHSNHSIRIQPVYEWCLEPYV